MRRPPFFLVALFLLLAACSGVVLAQEPDDPPEQPELRVRVDAGLTGDWALPGWSAIGVRVDNALGKAKPVELALLVAGDMGTTWSVRRRVDLPGKGTRREWFDVPLRLGSVTLTCQVRALGEDGEASGDPVAKGERAVTVSNESRAERSILFVSDRPTAQGDAATLLQVDPRGRVPQPVVRGLKPDELPHQAYGYGGLDLVAIHDADFSGTSVDQRRSLLGWVKRGGSVLLIPGRREGWLGSELLRSFTEGVSPRPFRVDRLPLHERRLEPLVRRGDPRPDLVIYTADGAQHLEVGGRSRITLVERRRFGHTYSFLQAWRCGEGSVYLMATDFGAAPFDRWKAQSTLLKVINGRLHKRLGFSRKKQREAFQRDEPRVRAVLADVLDSNERPSLVLITVLVLVYLLVVGPLNVRALEQRRRPLWAVLTIPFLALIFTVITIVTGVMTKGLGTVVWRVSVTRAELGATRGLEQTAVSLRTSFAGEHRVDFAPGVRATRVFRKERAAQATLQVLRDDQGPSFRDVRLDTWEQGVFEASSEVPLEKGVSLRKEAGGWVLGNGTGIDVRGAVILDTDDRLYRVDAVPDDASATAVTDALLPARHLAAEWVARRLASDAVEERLVREALVTYVARSLSEDEREDSSQRPVIVVLRLEKAPTEIKVDGEDEPALSLPLLILEGRP